MIAGFGFNWQRMVRIGAIGGLVGVLLSLVGMVETFSQRDIISGVISMGHLLLLLVVVLTGYLAARGASPSNPHSILASSLLTGLAVGSVIALLVLIGHLASLRSVFVNASPALFAILTFGRSMPVGILLLLCAGALGSGLTGLFYLLGPPFRRAMLVGLSVVVVMGVLQELVRITLAAWGPLAAISEWLYTAKGLTIQGAFFLFTSIAAGNYFWGLGGSKVQEQVRSVLPTSPGTLKIGAFLIAFLILSILPRVLGLFLSEVLTIIGLFALMGLGLNIVVGFSGLLDLGYVAFFAIGAYAMAVLTSPELGFFSLSFWEALPLAVLVGVLAGVILGVPVLRMRGDYLAIVTLGFGEIIRILALSDFLRPWLGGAQGIAQIPKASIGDIEFASPQQLYYIVLVGCLLAGFISWRLKNSRIGRAWMAIREDEDVAAAMGINLVSYKLLAFSIGAAFAALSGTIFASKLGSIYPHSFSLLISINVLALVIVGGVGNIPAVLIGAFVLVGLPELLRELTEYRLLVYGAALVVMMLLKPAGFWPDLGRQRELQGTESRTSTRAQSQQE